MLQKTDFLDLSRKVAIISGGAEGIGIETAELLSAYGAKIALLDMSSTGHKGIERLCSAGRVAKFYSCDVTKFEDCKYVVEEIKKDFGRVDILFNNVEVTFRKTVVDIEEKESDLILDVGLKGTYQLSKVAIPVMAQGGGGSIINTSSGWAIKDSDKTSAYCAIKRGIVNLTKDMAIDYEAKNIRVNSINVDDAFTKRIKDKEHQLEFKEKSFLNDSPKSRMLNKLGMPEDITKAILFLASDLSSWVTGNDLVINKGIIV